MSADVPLPLSDLLTLITVNRDVLEKEHVERSTLEDALSTQQASFDAKLTQAISLEARETAALKALDGILDDASLTERAAVLATAESELEARMSDYKRLVIENDDLAAKVMQRFDRNKTQVNDVKVRISSLISKLQGMTDSIEGFMAAQKNVVEQPVSP